MPRRSSRRSARPSRPMQNRVKKNTNICIGDVHTNTQMHASAAYAQCLHVLNGGLAVVFHTTYTHSRTRAGERAPQWEVCPHARRRRLRPALACAQWRPLQTCTPHTHIHAHKLAHRIIPAPMWPTGGIAPQWEGCPHARQRHPRQVLACARWRPLQTRCRLVCVTAAARCCMRRVLLQRAAAKTILLRLHKMHYSMENTQSIHPKKKKKNNIQQTILNAK